MGCCVSTHGTSTKHQNFQAVSESLKPNSTCESRAPPPSIEEETVKEEVSEVCSLSFSETVSTTTFNNDKRDEDDDDGEEVKQRVKKSPVAKLTLGNKAVSGDFGPRRDRVLGKSPNRRIEQSPDKINNAGRGGGGSVRLVQSRESGTYQAGRTRVEARRK
ncbi:hypothetical protein GH714_001959 [Hevea brasiliensis]|uniref:Uncharacterized protein n=1 Tax=Hevea brasiliensis TaxID=3981 RepID=A0A6A6LZK5_HEVBR|nr:hypothetical protein GH714_001959 [Hevea brasiliensis]